MRSVITEETRRILLAYHSPPYVESIVSDFTGVEECSTFGTQLKSDFQLYPTRIGFSLSPTHCDFPIQLTLSVIAFAEHYMRYPTPLQDAICVVSCMRSDMTQAAFSYSLR